MEKQGMQTSVLLTLTSKIIKTERSLSVCTLLLLIFFLYATEPNLLESAVKIPSREGTNLIF